MENRIYRKLEHGILVPLPCKLYQIFPASSIKKSAIMEQVKKKRIVTKIGHVFCIEIDNQYKCYFQYICNDLHQLNSSVIRVFKKRYPMDYVPVIEDIVNDEVSFYAHTVLKFGIADGAWYRVGKSMDFSESDFDNVLFVTSHDSRIIRVKENWK